MANILGISLSTRVIGLAIFDGQKLMDWKLKCFFDAWSDKKYKDIIRFITDTAMQNNVTAIAVKIPDALPISKSFIQIIGSLNVSFEQQSIPVHYFMVSDLKERWCGSADASKYAFIESIAQRYPQLAVEHWKECKNQRPHYDKIFEAVGAAYSLMQALDTGIDGNIY